MLKPREVKLLAQGHMANKRQSWNLTTGWLTPRTGLSITAHVDSGSTTPPAPSDSLAATEERVQHTFPDPDLASVNYWLGEGQGIQSVFLPPWSPTGLECEQNVLRFPRVE